MQRVAFARLGGGGGAAARPPPTPLRREAPPMERSAAATSSSSSTRLSPLPPPLPRPGLGEGVAWAGSHIRRGPECAHSGGDDALVLLLPLAPPPPPMARERRARAVSFEQFAVVAFAPAQPAVALGSSGMSTHSVTLTAARVRCQPGHAA
eukprot:scaffold100332_cov69-Phaeocystis_antarctica.AAC.4